MLKEREHSSQHLLTRRKLLTLTTATLGAGLARSTEAFALSPSEDREKIKSQEDPRYVLMYHDLNNPRNSDEEMNWVPVKRFQSQLEQLISTGHQFGTLSEAILDPENIIALTFDDGIHTAYDLIYPFLKSKGISATFFIPVASILSKNKYFMTPLQVKELSDAGFQIGSHSYNHIKLTTRNKGELRSELRKSKEWLEDLIEKEVELFAYPGGDYNEGIAEETFSAGYKAAFIARSSKILGLRQPLERYELPRYWITEETDISKIFPKPSPFGLPRLTS